MLMLFVYNIYCIDFINVCSFYVYINYYNDSIKTNFNFYYIDHKLNDNNQLYLHHHLYHKDCYSMNFM